MSDKPISSIDWSRQALASMFSPNRIQIAPVANTQPFFIVYLQKAMAEGQSNQ